MAKYGSDLPLQDMMQHQSMSAAAASSGSSSWLWSWGNLGTTPSTWPSGGGGSSSNMSSLSSGNNQVSRSLGVCSSRWTTGCCMPVPPSLRRRPRTRASPAWPPTPPPRLILCLLLLGVHASSSGPSSLTLLPWVAPPHLGFSLFPVPTPSSVLLMAAYGSAPCPFLHLDPVSGSLTLHASAPI